MAYSIKAGNPETEKSAAARRPANPGGQAGPRAAFTKVSTVVDVHRDFEAETDVVERRGFPSHNVLLSVLAFDVRTETIRLVLALEPHLACQLHEFRRWWTDRLKNNLLQIGPAVCSAVFEAAATADWSWGSIASRWLVHIDQPDVQRRAAPTRG